MKLFQLFFIFLVAPAFTNGIKCGYGGICYGNGMDISPFPLATKDCADACVAFKCMTNSFMVMEGAGCYEDFDKACKSTATYLKDEIKANIGNYDIVNTSLEFHSCSDSENCATNMTLDPWKIDNRGTMNFTEQGYSDQFSDLVCEFDTESKVFLDKVECKTLNSCESSVEYNLKEYKHPLNGSAKSCDACVRYECTNDAGKTINLGYGCYEDFEAACTTVPSDVKENIKKNINDSFYFDEKMYKIFSCRDEDNCHIWSTDLFSYDAVNKYQKVYTYGTFTKDCSEPTTQKPEPEIQSTEAPIPTGGATLNEFGMKFFGLILLIFFIF